jgi:hypothetical protein
MEEFIKTELKELTAGDQPMIRKMLKSISSHRSYYAGGSLVVDCKGGVDCLVMNLDGYVGYFSEKTDFKLTRENQILLFKVYKEHKGETKHYTDSLKEAGIEESEIATGGNGQG